MKRRSLLKTMGGLLVAPSVISATPSMRRKPALRIAHITDIHLKDEWGAPGHFRDCLHHVQALSPRVDMILNGGDVVFDMNKENLSAIKEQWQLYHSIIRNESDLPVHYALGNHDIWWYEDDRGQALYGKKFSMDQLGLTLPYYSFTKAGWKFIVLDSVHLDIDDTWYIGKLGETQFAWLENELNATNGDTPICILSHIPILTATNMLDAGVVNKWEILGGDMHTDTVKIIELLYHHPNVKLCLSGHIHIREKLVYNNVTYLCNGAVSGAWWKGNRQQTAPGYGLIDLYADGSLEERYVNY